MFYKNFKTSVTAATTTTLKVSKPTTTPLVNCDIPSSDHSVAMLPHPPDNRIPPTQTFPSNMPRIIGGRTKFRSGSSPSHTTAAITSRSCPTSSRSSRLPRKQRFRAIQSSYHNKLPGTFASSGNLNCLATIAVGAIMTFSSAHTNVASAFVAPPSAVQPSTRVAVDPSFPKIIQQQQKQAGNGVGDALSDTIPPGRSRYDFRDCHSIDITEYTSSSSTSTSTVSDPEEQQYSLHRRTVILGGGVLWNTCPPFTASSSVSASTSITSAPEEHQYSLRKRLNVADTPYNPTPEELIRNFPKVVGHRGCLYLELENTREGFSRCHDMGCEAVELDVFKVRRKAGTVESNGEKDDTTLVVFHGGGTDENPGDLLDYCRIDGSILDYNYETEIREKLTFNPDYAEFPCPVEKIRDGEIPTLEDVLLDAKRKNNDPGQTNMHIKIELKGPDVVEGVLDLVDSLDVADMCSYSSFDLQKLERVRKLRPQRCPSTGEYLYKTGALFNHIDSSGRSLDDDYYAPPSAFRGSKNDGVAEAGKDWADCDVVERALAVGATEVHLKYDTCTRDLVERIHASGLGSMAWFRGPIGMGEDTSSKYLDVGNEDLSMYEAVVRTGVQQLCVNKPDVLIELRERLWGQSQRTEGARPPEDRIRQLAA